MRVLVTIVAAVVVLGLASAAHAQKSAVQISPDGKRSMINKNVNGARWVITQNGDDQSVTGNVFFTDGRDPAFLFCSLSGTDGDPSPLLRELRYACFGADRCAAAPCIATEDWGSIAEVTLPGEFFLPPIEDCNASAITNGPSASGATSRWECGGSGSQGFQWQLFADGTGFSTAAGSFTFQQTSCAFGEVVAQGQNEFLFFAGSRTRGKLFLQRRFQSGQVTQTLCDFLPF